MRKQDAQQSALAKRFALAAYHSHTRFYDVRRERQGVYLVRNKQDGYIFVSETFADTLRICRTN